MGKQAIRVHMDEGLVAEIDEQADREDRSRNWTINDLVRRGLAAVRTEEAVNRIGEQLIGPGVLDKPGAPAAPVDAPPSGPPAAPANVPKGRPGRRVPNPPGPEGPAKPHRHRFQIEVAGTREGRAGVLVADYACACGKIKKGLAVR